MLKAKVLARVAWSRKASTTAPRRHFNQTVLHLNRQKRIEKNKFLAFWSQFALWFVKNRAELQNKFPNVPSRDLLKYSAPLWLEVSDKERQTISEEVNSGTVPIPGVPPKLRFASYYCFVQDEHRRLKAARTNASISVLYKELREDWKELEPEDYEKYLLRAIDESREPLELVVLDFKVKRTPALLKDRVWTQAHQEAFERIKKALKITYEDDWYSVTPASLVGAKVDDLYLSMWGTTSIYDFVCNAYPQHQWIKSKFALPATTFWHSTDNVDLYLRWLWDTLKMRSLHDWYDVSYNTIAETGGLPILKSYGGSIVDTLSAVYPNHEWVPWRFSAFSVPNGYWTISANQRKFFDWLYQELELTTMDDWFAVSPSVVRGKGGAALLRHYFKDSLPRALAAIYPEHEWPEHRFSHVPIGFWEDVKHQRIYFDWLAATWGISNLEDWYNVRGSDVPARSVLGKYGGSLARTLVALYPEHNWEISRFHQTSKATRRATTDPAKPVPPENLQDQIRHERATSLRQKLEKAGEELGVKSLDDWYNHKMSELHNRPGLARMIKDYGSLPAALEAAYPTHNWLEWMFPAVRDNYWDSFDNQIKFFDWLYDKLQFKTKADWYSVTVASIDQAGGHGILSRHAGSLANALQAIYPTHPWEEFKFVKQPKLEAGTWSDPKVQKKFLAWLAKKLNINSNEDWYSVSQHDLLELKAGRFLAHFGGSMISALVANYPQHHWKVWKFKKLPDGSWANPALQRRFWTEIGDELGVKTLEDWYKVKVSSIIELAGTGPLVPFGQTNVIGLTHALAAAYPEHLWESVRFHADKKEQVSGSSMLMAVAAVLPGLPQSNVAQQQKEPILPKPSKTTTPKAVKPILLPKDLNLAKTQTTSGVSRQGSTPIPITESVLAAATSAIKGSAPQEQEAPISSSPIVTPTSNLLAYVSALEKLLDISKHEDWKKITKNRLRRVGALEFCQKSGGLDNVLAAAYPDRDWTSILNRATVKATKVGETN